MNNDLIALKKAYQTNNLTILIGAGLSKPLEIPDMKELSREIMKSLKLDDINLESYINSYDFSNFYDSIVHKYSSENQIQELIGKIISEKIEIVNYYDDNNYRDLSDMSNATFITLNYDDLLYRHIKNTNENIKECYLENYEDDLIQIRKNITYLHGKYNKCNTIIITREAYRKKYFNEIFNKKLENIFASQTILILGCSYNEKEIRELISEIRKYTNTYLYIVTLEEDKIKEEGKNKDNNVILLPVNNFITGIRSILNIIKSEDSIVNSVLNDNFFKQYIYKYFSKPFQRICELNISDEFFYLSSGIFKKIISANYNQDIRYDLKDYINLYEGIAKNIYCNNNEHPVCIRGPRGTGKSMIMCFLYLYLMKKYYSDPEDNYYPVYIDLSYYLGFEYLSEIKKDKKEDFSLTDFEKAVIQNIDKILEQVVKKNKFILLIDGHDEFFDIKGKMLDKINNEIKIKCSNSRCIKKIVSVSEHPIAIKSIDNKNPIIDIETRKIYKYTDDYNYDFILNQYILLLEKIYERNRGNILDIIKDFKQVAVNLFLINITFNHNAPHEKISKVSKANLYESYCNDKLRGYFGKDTKVINDKINNLAEKAFYLTSSNKYYINIEEMLDNNEYLLLNKHESIIEYYTAVYLTREDNILKNLVFKDDEYIFIHTIYSFSKDIIFEYGDSLLMKNINSCYSNNQKLSNFAVYLLGRVTSESSKEVVIHILENNLREYLYSEKQTNPNEIPYGFQIRTIYISLANLGKNAHKETYLNRLFEHSDYDSLNSGFYREYYGDSVSFTSRKTDDHKDNGGSFEKTFNIISNRIRTMIEKEEKTYPLFEIELYTLCSLFQKRYYDKSKSGIEKKQLLELLKLIHLSNVEIYIDKLAAYIKMIESHLEYNFFNISIIFFELYSFIEHKRNGWINRNVRNGESVIEHIFFCLLIADVLLPESNEKEVIEKYNIMKMLLYHDLPENSTGDITPKEISDNPNYKAIQEDYCLYLSLLSTYPGIKGTNNMYDLFKEFEQNRHEERYRIATDIDKFDAWFRCVYYNLIGKKHLDTQGFKEVFKSDLLKSFAEKTSFSPDVLKSSKKYNLFIYDSKNSHILKENKITIPRNKIFYVNDINIEFILFVSREKMNSPYKVQHLYGVLKKDTCYNSNVIFCIYELKCKLSGFFLKKNIKDFDRLYQYDHLEKMVTQKTSHKYYIYIDYENGKYND